MHIISRAALAAAFLFLLPLAGHAASLNELIPPDTDLGAVLPDRQSAVGRAFAMNGRVSGDFHGEMTKEPGTGRIVSRVHGAMADTVATLEPTVRLGSCETRIFRTEPEVLKHLGHDRRTTVREGERVLLTLFRDDKAIKEKSVHLPGRVLPVEAANVILQAALLKGLPGSFSADLAIGSKAMTATGVFELRESKDPASLSPDYAWPAGMAAALSTGESYYVFEIQLGGLIGLFARAKYFLALRQEPPHAFAAFWGGPDGDQEYVYCTSAPAAAKAD